MDSINIISYYYSLVTSWLSYYVGYLIDEFRGFSTVVQIAVIGITFCLLLIIYTLIRLLVQAWKNRKLRKVYNRLEQRYGEGIDKILSPDGNPNMTRQDVLDALELTESDVNGQILLKDDKESLCMSRLIYRKRISENAAIRRRKNLHIVLRMFRIQEFLELMVNKGKMSKKAEALHMLRAFKLPVNPWVANQLMNSNKLRVKRLAIYASIMSGSNTDLEYFESDFFDEHCCIYDEIQLGYALQRRKSAKRKIPNLAILAMKQKNPSTQCVFIRLMRQFNQKEYCGELTELFQLNSDSELIEEISRTWGYLKYNEGEDLMNEVILTQNDQTKIAIMHALTRLGTGKSLGTLIDGFKNNGDPIVRYEALRCLWNYGKEGREKFEELKETSTKADQFLFDFFDHDYTRERIPLSKNDHYHQAYGENLYSVV